LIALAKETYVRFTELMDDFKFNEALEAVWKLIRRANKYVDETEPWILGRDEENLPRLNRVLYNLAETLRIVAQLIEPTMKDTTKIILEKLGTDNKGFESTKEFGLLEEGAKVSKDKNLFDRLDVEEELVKLHDKKNGLIQARLADKKEDEKEVEDSSKPEIAYEDFTKIDLVVGKILEAEDHPNADKLLVFKVDIGTETRTIVSGIKKWYKAE